MRVRKMIVSKWLTAFETKFVKFLSSSIEFFSRKHWFVANSTQRRTASWSPLTYFGSCGFITCSTHCHTLEYEIEEFSSISINLLLSYLSNRRTKMKMDERDEESNSDIARQCCVDDWMKWFSLTWFKSKSNVREKRSDGDGGVRLISFSNSVRRRI